MFFNSLGFVNLKKKELKGGEFDYSHVDYNDRVTLKINRLGN